jgi:hypothetical protein
VKVAISVICGDRPMQRHLVQCSIKCGRGTGINVVIRWICPIYFVGHSALLRANAVPMISFR